MMTRELRFLRPSRELREFYILRAIENNPNASQRTIARAALVSSTMVNNYLGEMVSHDWVDIIGDTNRSYEYRITDTGRQRKSELLFQISKEVVQMFGLMKLDFTARLKTVSEQGIRRVVLFGASETGELAYAASREAGLDVVAIVDNDAAKHGRIIGRHPVEAPAVIEERRPDAVLIASHGHADEIYEQIKHLTERGIRVLRV
jgi:predicted transcriptional regulator